MTTVFDVARYILKKHGPRATMNLHKLVYYCQAWSLVWTDKPLFHEKFVAWPCGPVCQDLYEIHKGQYIIGSSMLNGKCHSTLTEDEIDTINTVLDYYMKFEQYALKEQVTSEYPYKKAWEKRKNEPDSKQEITISDIKKYYRKL